MATNLARLDIVISASTGDVQAGMKRVTTGLKGVDAQANRTSRGLGRMGDAFKAVMGAVIIRQIAIATSRMFELGASVEETQSKFSTVFGDSTDDMQEFLDVFANKAGLTNREAQNLLATTGAIAQGMGFAVDASAAYAQEVAILAADITSFNDVAGGAAVVIEAINAAAAGERERLKQWGIQILDADVKSRALLDTGRSLASELTQQEKTAATLALIYEKVGVAVGDLDRTQLSAANTARRIGARFRELKEQLASALLPIFAQLLTTLDENDDAFDTLGAAIQHVARFITTGIAVVQLFAVELALMAAKGDAAWAKIKDAAANALLGAGVAGIITKFGNFMQGLPPWLQGVLGLNPIVAAGTGLAALLESDTGLALELAEANLARMVTAAQESRDEILLALNSALSMVGVDVPVNPERPDVEGAANDAKKLASVLATVEAKMAEIAAMTGIDTPMEQLADKAKVLEQAVRALAAAGLTGTAEYAKFRLEMERLNAQLSLAEILAAKLDKTTAKGLDDTAEAMTKLEDAARSFTDDFTTRIARATTDGADAFKGFADSVIGELNRILVKLLIIEGVKAFAGGNETLRQIVGAGPVTGKATGGLLTPFRPVKLHRDEVVVPLAPSVAIPSSIAGRGGGGMGSTFAITIPMTVQALDGRDAQRAMEAQRPIIADMVVDAIRNSGALRQVI